MIKYCLPLNAIVDPYTVDKSFSRKDPLSLRALARVNFTTNHSPLSTRSSVIIQRVPMHILTLISRDSFSILNDIDIVYVFHGLSGSVCTYTKKLFPAMFLISQVDESRQSATNGMYIAFSIGRKGIRLASIVHHIYARKILGIP